MCPPTVSLSGSAPLASAFTRSLSVNIPLSLIDLSSTSRLPTFFSFIIFDACLRFVSGWQDTMLSFLAYSATVVNSSSRVIVIVGVGEYSLPLSIVMVVCTYL